MNNYTTVQGDTWDIISFKLYNDERHMSELMEVNQQNREITVFPANLVLKVPEITVTIPNKLPPWKRKGL